MDRGPVKIGWVELGSVPRVAVPLSDVEVQQHGTLVKDLADFIELRIDSFQKHDIAHVTQICKTARNIGLPLIATVRSADEGGAVRLPDEQRLRIFDAVAPLVDALDIEFHSPLRDKVIKIARFNHKRTIASLHDFKRTPLDRDLVAVAEVARWHNADIAKLAVTAQNSLDVDRLLGILRQHREKHLIIIALGPHGTVSRVFFPIFGSLLTYAYLNEANAPGQLSLAEVVSELRRYSPEFVAMREARARQASLQAKTGEAAAKA